MRTKRQKLGALIVSVAAISVTGCFGESILSAGAKVAGGQMSQLTPNEIKILNQTVIDLLSADNPGFNPLALTDPQADAISNFLSVNELNTFEDIEAIVDLAQTNPEQIQGLEELAAAFEGTDTVIDPDNLDPSTLDDVFGSLFGGSSGGQSPDPGVDPNAG